MLKQSVVHSPASISLGEICEIVGGKLIGDPSLQITGACGIEFAQVNDISYIRGSVDQNNHLKRSKASAIFVDLNCAYNDKPVIQVADPAKAFLKILRLWHTGTEKLSKIGIHPKAVIDPSTKLGQNIFVGAGVVIEEGVSIADGCTILANTFIGANVSIGKDTLIHHNTTIEDNVIIDNNVIIHSGVVIGSDGFGYENIDNEWVKVPQRGKVWIQENVEIGANSCVDRARFGTTVVKKGAKIDNLVQIAHNVTIGERCLLVSQVGIAGSSELGDDVMLGGQVGVSGHVHIGNRSQIAAQSGCFTNIAEDQILLGSPPRPFRQEKEIIVYTSRLPKLFKEVRDIKKKLAENS